MSTFNLVFIIVISFYCGYKVNQMIMRYAFRKIMKMLSEQHNINIVKELSNKETIEIPNLFTEINGSSIMLYTSTDNFVCQAHSLEELAQTLLEYKKINRAIVKHADEQLLFVEGKVEKYSEQ